MTTTINWPLVHERDDGIRPAGGAGQCFYCRKWIGEPHAKDCVIVTKRVLVRIEGLVTGTWEFDTPHSFDSNMIEYLYNDGTWCADGVLSEEGVTWVQEDAQKQLKMAQESSGCLCNVLRFKFDRVLDETPRRKLKEN